MFEGYRENTHSDDADPNPEGVSGGFRCDGLDDMVCFGS